MKAAVLTFPGSNCDDDLLWAVKDIAGLMPNWFLPKANRWMALIWC